MYIDASACIRRHQAFALAPMAKGSDVELAHRPFDATCHQSTRAATKTRSLKERRRWKRCQSLARYGAPVCDVSTNPHNSVYINCKAQERQVLLYFSCFYNHVIYIMIWSLSPRASSLRRYLQDASTTLGRDECARGRSGGRGRSGQRVCVSLSSSSFSPLP